MDVTFLSFLFLMLGFSLRAAEKERKVTENTNWLKDKRQKNTSEKNLGLRPNLGNTTKVTGAS